MLADIVENLLELSRYQSMRLVLQSAPSDIAVVAQDIARRAQEKSSKHDIILNLPPDLPQVLIDRIRIERVLQNLVDNAIKYSPEGGEVRIFSLASCFWDLFQQDIIDQPRLPYFNG